MASCLLSLTFALFATFSSAFHAYVIPVSATQSGYIRPPPSLNENATQQYGRYGAPILPRGTTPFDPKKVSELPILTNNIIDKIQCHPKPAEKAPHHDVHEKNVYWTAYDFCTVKAPQSPLQRPMPAIEATYETRDAFGGSHHKDELSDYFRVSVKDVGDQCVHGDFLTVDVLFPTGDSGEGGLNLCESIIYGLWKHFDNAGMGGSVEFGCLKYELTPLMYKSETDMAREGRIVAHYDE